MALLQVGQAILASACPQLFAQQGVQLEALAVAVEDAQQRARTRAFAAAFFASSSDEFRRSGHQRQPEAFLHADGAGGEKLLFALGLRLDGRAEESVNVVLGIVDQVVAAAASARLASRGTGLHAAQQAGADGHGDGQQSTGRRSRAAADGFLSTSAAERSESR